MLSCCAGKGFTIESFSAATNTGKAQPQSNFERISQMTFDSSIYYGHIIKGDLRSTIAYIKQFPDKTDLYNRFMEVFDQEQYIRYDVDDDLNEILTAYQRYYRDVFYLGIGREQSAQKLRAELATLLGAADPGVELCDLEQNQLVDAFESRGLHFMGGKSGG